MTSGTPLPPAVRAGGQSAVTHRVTQLLVDSSVGSSVVPPPDPNGRYDHIVQTGGFSSERNLSWTVDGRVNRKPSEVPETSFVRSFVG